MAQEIKRWIKKEVEHAKKVWRIVLIAGARQSGKSTLLRDCLKKSDPYHSLDDYETMKAAVDSPRDFVANPRGTMGIDEIQKLPELISNIKLKVDLNPRKGQYLISGSSDLRFIPEIHESLAGRMRRIPLRTLAEGEIRRRQPTFLQRAFTHDFPRMMEGVSKAEVLRLALRGGYPEVLDLSPADRSAWHLEYVQKILLHDLRDIINIRRMDAMRHLLEAFAAWSSKYMEVGAVCSKLEMTGKTFNAYANALTGLYLHEILPPWINSDYDRIGRRPKSFITDSGLIGSLLQWDETHLMMDPDRAGKLVETFVFHELSAHIGTGDDYAMYHYRDRTDHEIDFVIRHRKTGDLLLIDAKAGSNIGPESFRHMRWFREHIAPKDVNVHGIVLYSGNAAYTMRDGFMAVPTSALWE